MQRHGIDYEECGNVNHADATIVLNTIGPADIESLHGIYDELLELFSRTTGGPREFSRILSEQFSISLSDSQLRPTLLRMQWAMQLSRDFVPNAYRSIPELKKVLEWPL